VYLPPGCRLSIEKDPSWTDREFVDEALGAYNAPFLADDRYDYFGIFVRDHEDTIRAVLIGSLYAGWLWHSRPILLQEMRLRVVGERRAVARTHAPVRLGNRH
jgi:hypothetical protein